MWIIDSDATLHVTPRKEFFTSYTSRDFGMLKMSNDGVTKVIGVGDICLQTNTRMQLWLRGVKHAPDVRFNLISMHMLDDGGYDNHFGYGKWKFTKGNLVVARGEKISKLYWIKTLVAKDSLNIMDMEAFLWYRRLSHISEKLLNCLSKKDMLPGLKNAELEKCSHCMVGLCACPKDERSKLDMKIRQFIFIGYGHDEYGYKMYDPVEKKLFRSCDVQFMEDQTIEDIDKNSEQHNYVGDQQLGDGFDIPLDDNDEEEQEMSQDENLGDALEPPPVQLRRSNRQRQSSTRYISDESKHIDMRYHWIRDALDAKLLELAKVHTDDNDADMMTKTVPRGKFEACCEIFRLAITST
ncbi:hypothetical protein CR513_23897, partial [Mucuna pruriens]